MPDGPYILLKGRSWARANPAKPAWMNPSFRYGPPVGTKVPCPEPVYHTCPKCHHRFTEGTHRVRLQ